MRKDYQEAGDWVIGAILQDLSENFPRARRMGMRSGDFLNPVHQQIFRGIESLHENRDDAPFELSVLYSLLKGDGLSLAKYLEQDIPTAAGLDYWCRVVLEGSRIRELRELMAEDDLDVTHAEAIFEDLRGLNKADKLLYRSLGHIPPLSEDPRNRIPTGFVDLDRNIAFGLGHLMMIAGKTSLGKTSLGLQLAYHIGRQRGGWGNLS